MTDVDVMSHDPCCSLFQILVAYKVSKNGSL